MMFKNEILFLERLQNTEEWSWYEKYIVNYFLHDLKLSGRFTPAQIHRAIGLINVNAVALKFPMNSTSKWNFRIILKKIYWKFIFFQPKLLKGKDFTPFLLLVRTIAFVMLGTLWTLNREWCTWELEVWYLWVWKFPFNTFQLCMEILKEGRKLEMSGILIVFVEGAQIPQKEELL